MTDTAIAEYKPTEAALAELREQYAGAIFNVTNKVEMKKATYARGVLRGLRKDLEAERVRIKAPALERSRAIDGEARRITAELRSLEDPIDAQIKEETGRKKREHEAAEQAEYERLADIKQKVADIERWPLAMVGCDSEEIAKSIKSLMGMVINTDDFGEFAVEAEAVHGESLRKVTELHASTVEAESQKAEIDRLRSEQDERAKEEQARIAEDVRVRAEAEAESRRKIEEAERESREKIEKEQRASREVQEKSEAKERAARIAKEDADRAKREKVEAKAREKREAKEAADRDKRREASERADGREMLELFTKRFGKNEEFDTVVAAINEYLGKSS